MRPPPLRPESRSAARTVLSALMALALALAPAGGGALAAGRRAIDLDAPTERWREGPVRYLLSKDEDAAFRALGTDEERARYIHRFWAGRDPDPTTPENEYRDLFYRRVQEADRLFSESTTRGWKTDRGKIYVLIGPPDDFDQSSSFDRGRTPDMILWTYRDPPPGVALGGDSTLRFVRDRSGEYRISNPVILTGPWTPLAGGFQIQAMQMKSVPEPHQVLDDIVSARSFLDAAPFRTRGDHFRAADGNTFTVLTLGIRRGSLEGKAAAPSPSAASGGAVSPGAGPAPGAAAPAPGGHRMEVMARLIGEEAGAPTYDLAGPDGLRPVQDGSPDGPAEYLQFQGGTALAPGCYTVYYGIVDRATGRIYSFRETLAVPDFRGGGLGLSSVTLASRLERVPEGTAPGGAPAPFAIGSLRVQPRADDVFRNGEQFAFYYQIYGTTTDPINGRPDLDLEYQFFVAESLDEAGQPVFAPLGQPIHLIGQQSQAQGYSFPLKDWPPATYRLRVRVTDNLGGRQSSRDVTFRVL